ncbi:hypothetical protein KKC17_01445 [Patescibacteria group bacterium]|nr:hypothetical protein [Patescibacteria group bacterium]
MPLKIGRAQNRFSDKKKVVLFFLLLFLISCLAFFSISYSWRLADKKPSVDLFQSIKERLTNISPSSVR